jgi:hypothetical protein
MTNYRRIKDHENRLKIIAGVSGDTQTRTIVSESWRSGGGAVPHTTDRATCVRRIIDPEFVWFGGTSRYGAGIE